MNLQSYDLLWEDMLQDISCIGYHLFDDVFWDVKDTENAQHSNFCSFHFAFNSQAKIGDEMSPIGSKFILRCGMKEINFFCPNNYKMVNFPLFSIQEIWIRSGCARN